MKKCKICGRTHNDVMNELEIDKSLFIADMCVICWAAAGFL